MSKKTIPLRKRDLLTIKIVDWSDDPADCEPAIDVEVYVNGKFDPEQSDVFPIQKKNHEGQTKKDAIRSAYLFANARLRRFQVLKG